MCFHCNQHPWAIKHPFISLYSKYHSLYFICLPVMNSPVFPSLDDIYCILFSMIVSDVFFCKKFSFSSWSSNSSIQVSSFVFILSHYHSVRFSLHVLILLSLLFDHGLCLGDWIAATRTCSLKFGVRLNVFHLHIVNK